MFVERRDLPIVNDLLIIGGGMATGRLVKGLSEGGYGGSVTVICAEAVFGYNRVLLPDYVSGDCTDADLFVRDDVNTCLDFNIRCGEFVEFVNTTERWVRLNSGEQLHYESLVFATGSVVPSPDLSGIETDNVIELRSIEDARNLQKLAASASKALVLGGGLLGLEAGKALLQLGLDVCVVHRSTHLMNRQLDAEGAELLRQKLQEQGFRFVLGQTIAKVHGESSVASVELEDGGEMPADLLLIATGAQANDSLALITDIECDGGICVNEQLETSVAGVFAIGECALVNEVHYTLVEPVFHQADVLAANLCGEKMSCEFPAPSTRLKVSGIEVFSTGVVSDAAVDADVRIASVDVYRRLLFRRDVLQGAILIGDAVGSQNIYQSIGQKVSHSQDRERLAFGL
jgi:nitrite reductase (NADH) large subunit|tara:strand:- start:6584 stop:7789 length:1206 start_codon:yes stop_codon:yes gene_type:complete